MQCDINISAALDFVHACPVWFELLTDVHISKYPNVTRVYYTHLKARVCGKINLCI